MLVISEKNQIIEQLKTELSLVQKELASIMDTKCTTKTNNYSNYKKNLEETKELLKKQFLKAESMATFEIQSFASKDRDFNPLDFDQSSIPIK